MWTLVYFSVQAGGWRAAKMLHCLSLNKKVCERRMTWWKMKEMKEGLKKKRRRRRTHRWWD